MSDSYNTSSSSVSIVGLLGVCFIVQKLCGVIDWSWWWVTLPFWVIIPVLLVIALVVGVCALIAARLK